MASVFLNRLPFDNTMFISPCSLSWYVATPSIGHYGIPSAFLPKAVPAFFAVLRGRVPCNVCDQVFVLVRGKPRDQLSNTMYFNWVWGVRIRVHQQHHGWPVSWWGYIRKYVCGIDHGVCMLIKWFVIEAMFTPDCGDGPEWSMVCGTARAISSGILSTVPIPTCPNIRSQPWDCSA